MFFIARFLFLLFLVNTSVLFAAQEKIKIINFSEKGSFSRESTILVNLPDWSRIDFLVNKFIQHTFPENAKNIQKTEIGYTTDQRAADLIQMLGAFREIYNAIGAIEGNKSMSLLQKKQYITVVISNFIGLVERFNLLLRNRWYMGIESLQRASVQYDMMADVLKTPESQELFNTWFEFSGYVFNFLKRYKKFDLNSLIEVKYFPIPKSSHSGQDTSFLLGYLKTHQGYCPFVLDKSEAFEAYSIPFLTEDGMNSYAIHAEHGELIKDSMIVFSEDKRNDNWIITAELAHGVNSKTPLVKEHLGSFPYVSLKRSNLQHLRTNNLGFLSGYLSLPLNKQERAAFKLVYLEMLKDAVVTGKEDEKKEFFALAQEMVQSGPLFPSRALGFLDDEREIREGDLIIRNQFDESGGESSTSKVDEKEELSEQAVVPVQVEHLVKEIESRIAEINDELEAEIKAELEAGEKEIGDFKEKKSQTKKQKKVGGKKGKGKKKGEQKGLFVKQNRMQQVQQKIEELKETYKLTGRIKMREWQGVVNSLSADIKDLREEVGILDQEENVINIVGSHSVLHSEEGAFTLVRPHKHKKDKTYDAGVLNDAIDKYISVSLMRLLGKAFDILDN
jgi:hypothetical protein